MFSKASRLLLTLLLLAFPRHIVGFNTLIAPMLDIVEDLLVHTSRAFRHHEVLVPPPVEPTEVAKVPSKNIVMGPQGVGGSAIPTGSQMVISEEKIGKRVVILGSGWASQSCIKIINDKNPEVDSITVVSPLNYFLFTPLLLSASVGTVEVRSIVEPIRSTNPFVKHIEGAAYKVDPFKKLVHIEPVLTHNPNNVTNVTIPYDTLVVSVGKEATTRAVPGARDCVFQLKTAEDAQLIRRCIVDSFERATLAMQSGTKSWKKVRGGGGGERSEWGGGWGVVYL